MCVCVHSLDPSGSTSPWPSYTMRPLGWTLAILPATYMSGALLGGNSLKRLLPRSRTYRLS